MQDPDQDGQPHPHAWGDDLDGNDDDNGVVFSPLYPWSPASMTVNLTDDSGAGGAVDVWVDWNQDGDWFDPGEQLFNARPVS